MLQHTIYSSSRERERGREEERKRGETERDGEGELGPGHIGYNIRSLIFIGSSKGHVLLDLWKRRVPWGFHNLSNL